MITPKPGQLIRFKDRKLFPNGEIYLVIERCPPPEEYMWGLSLVWKVITPAGKYDYVQDIYLKQMEVVKT